MGNFSFFFPPNGSQADVSASCFSRAADSVLALDWMSWNMCVNESVTWTQHSKLVDFRKLPVTLTNSDPVELKTLQRLLHFECNWWRDK